MNFICQLMLGRGRKYLVNTPVGGAGKPETAFATHCVSVACRLLDDSSTAACVRILAPYSMYTVVLHVKIGVIFM